MTDDVGVVGLGLMGSAMAGRLLEQGYAVHGYDPVAAAGAGLGERGLVRHDSLAELAGAVPIAILSLPEGRHARAASLELGATPDRRLRVILDTTTSRPREAESLAAEVAELPETLAFHDIGVSGASSSIARGHGLALVAGDPPEPALRVLGAICDDIVRVGGPGDGMRAKLVVNMVLGLNRLALAEALTLGETMSLDTRLLLDVLQRSAARSHAMSIWGERMVEGRFDDPTSRISQHTKDVAQMLELGEEHRAPMLGASLLAQIARQARAAGYTDLDNSVQIEPLRAMAGLPPRVPSGEAPAAG